jgi:PAS domain S-box-containing protein
MKPKQHTIRRKLIMAIMGTSVSVLIITCGVFIAYEVVTLRKNMVWGLMTRAEIIAANSTAALAFENVKDATGTLAALQKDPRMMAGCVYDVNGHVFATYPADAPLEMFPQSPLREAYYFDRDSLNLFVPVVQDGRRLGTVYLKSDLGALSQRYRVYTIVVISVIASAILLAFALSIWLQKRIAEPIQNLARTMRGVSERKDYSLRTSKTSSDEIGLLTDSFNTMLGEIQQSHSSLREGEARMRAVLESALDAIVTMDHEGNIVAFNPAAEKLFGYKREDVVGRSLSETIMPPRFRLQHHQGLARYLKTGQERVIGRQLEMAAMRNDGSEFPIELAITLIAQDGPPMFTGFIRDITARKRAEQEIRQLNAELEHRVVERTAELEASNKDLESFSYSVSHDLRAPLRAIDGFSKALLEDLGEKLEEPHKDSLARIRAATGQMALLIDELLKLSSMGLAPMKRQNVNLSRIATEIADQLHKDDPKRNVSFAIAQGLVANADPELTRLVLDNLLRNAWKFTSKHPSAHIEMGGTEADGERAFFVRDDGAGFDKAHTNLLFKPFQRLHRKTDFEGTGIGLATVHRVIVRHGGRLWAEGAVEQGAAFYFTFGKDNPDAA